MPQKESSLRSYVLDMLLGCLPALEGESVEEHRLRAAVMIEQKLARMPVNLLEQILTERRKPESPQQENSFTPGAAAALWQLGMREAEQVNSWPPSMAHSRDPERFAIGKEWFEAATGASLVEDLVELKPVANLPRHMLVTRVKIERTREALGGEAYAVLEGRVLRPYQISPVQRFYPGDTLRRMDDSESTLRELKAVERARVMLREQVASQS
jgi:hypothetical protein